MSPWLFKPDQMRAANRDEREEDNVSLHHPSMSLEADTSAFK